MTLTELIAAFVFGFLCGTTIFVVVQMVRCWWYRRALRRFARHEYAQQVDERRRLDSVMMMGEGLKR